jgi:3-oxoacyl-[acyl-carrier protein] reductase
MDWSMRWDEFQRHFEVQLHGAFNMIQAVLPFMRERKSGSIVNIASETTLGMPPAGMCDYVSAKYSVVGLTLALAVELGKQGIRVNAVSPGFIDTELTARLPRIYKELVMAKSATGKPTSVDDVANEVLFLLSENSSPLTGENRCVGSITRT